MPKPKVPELVIFYNESSQWFLSLAYHKVMKWITFILGIKYVGNSYMYWEKKMDFKNK